MHYLATEYDNHNRMRSAVLLALAAHAVLILSISFDAASSKRHTPQIEVTLTTRPSAAAPEDARLLAQANQQGSGDQAEINQVTSRNNSPPVIARPTPQTASQRPDNLADARSNVITTTSFARRMVTSGQEERETRQASLEGISPEVDRLSQELASLEAELDEQTQTYSTRPRVRRLTSASARQSVDAAYLLDWRRRLEAVGNKYYPRASVRYGIYGDVRLLVIIRQDGSLEDIRILSSSGYAVLDEAAIKTIRLAAPFSPFPAELRATTDKLEIIRTWQYLENGLSSK